MTNMSPITFAVLTVEAVDGKESASKLLVELIEELTRIFQARESREKKPSAWTNANIITIAGRPHDIRCPQTGRTDVSDCCKPMVAFTAMTEERQRCVDDVLSAWSASLLPEEHATWKRCQTAIHQKIRGRDSI